MPQPPFVFPNDPHVEWSIMIVLYPYITGLVAGAFVVSALYHVFHRDVLRPVARLALVTSLCFCAFATLPLLLHLRHPERAFNIMITPNATSAMAGFGFIYSVYMLLLLVEVWLVFRPTIVRRANAHPGLGGFLYRVLALGSREITDSTRAADAWAIRAGHRGDSHRLRTARLRGVSIRCRQGQPLVVDGPHARDLSGLGRGLGHCRAGGALLDHRMVAWRRRRRGLSARHVPILVDLSRPGGVARVAGAGAHGLRGRAEWHVLSLLLNERLAISYGLVQLLVGSVLPFFLLLTAFWSRLQPRLLALFGGLAASLVLVQVLAMRWNVVVGGQLFSKSFRGFVEYNVPWSGREGLIAAGLVLALPLVALWAAARILPLWQASES